MRFLFSFLQSVKVLLGGLPTLQHIGASPPQHATIPDLSESVFCSFYQITINPSSIFWGMLFITSITQFSKHWSFTVQLISHWPFILDGMQSLALTFDSKMGMRDCIKRLADVNANSIHCHVLIHRACHFVTGSSQVRRHDFPLFNLFLITFLFFGCLEVAFRTCSIKLQGSKVGWPGCHSPDHPSCLFRKVTWYIPLSVTRDLMQLPQFFTDDGGPVL